MYSVNIRDTDISVPNISALCIGCSLFLLRNWLVYSKGDILNNPMSRFLCSVCNDINPDRCLGIRTRGQSSFALGKKLFFTMEDGIVMKDLRPYFYLWPLFANICTYDVSFIKESVLYELGRFRTASKVTQLSWPRVSRPLCPPGFVDDEDRMLNIRLDLNELLDEISKCFEIEYYWIEDRREVLESMGLEIIDSLKIGEEESLVFKWHKDGTQIKRSLNTIKNELDNIEEQIANIFRDNCKALKIFIIDAFFGQEAKVKILGDNIIEVIRSYDNNNRKSSSSKLNSLLIVYTGSSSPWVALRVHSLQADATIFKVPTGGSHGRRYSHKIGGVSKGADEYGCFQLIGSFFWPLAVINHICLKLKTILESTSYRGEIKFSEILDIYREVQILIPCGFHHFWEDWRDNLLHTLERWQMEISVSYRPIFGRKLINEFQNDIIDILKGAYWKIPTI